MRYEVRNLAEDGEYINKFSTLIAADDYLKHQTGLRLSGWFQYYYDIELTANEIMEKRKGFARISDNWGRQFSIIDTSKVTN